MFLMKLNHFKENIILKYISNKGLGVQVEYRFCSLHTVQYMEGYTFTQYAMHIMQYYTDTHYAMHMSFVHCTV